MALLISNAIIHIVNNNGSGPLLSSTELEVDSETCFEFIGKHVRRLIKAPSARDATFRADSAVYSMVKAYQKGEMKFKDLSLCLADRLHAIMGDNREIPACDLLVCSFDYAKNTYLAIVKLPYSECFTHRILENESGTETQLVKNLSVLPSNGSKVTEACLIPYDPMILRVLEKPCPVNGEVIPYFSELFLECDTEISRKEAADVIQEIAAEVNMEYFQGNLEMESKIKCALVEQAPEEADEGLNLETAAKQAFGERTEAVERFVERAREMGLPHEVKLPKPYVQREFKMQRIKADNGIEIKFPVELSQDPDAIQIVTNHDGSLSITLKNLRSVGTN